MFRPLTSLFTFTALLCLALSAFGGEIHRAIEANDLGRVKQILDSDPGALTEQDDSQFRDLPIHVVANTGNVEIARLLLDAGAYIDAGDIDNSTALGIAAMRRHGDLVALLIERGANIHHRDRKADCPLSFAAYGRDETIIQQLLDAGADLYYRNPEGQTLLHVAAGRNLRDFAEHLLDNGADINARTDSGETPLGMACFQGHPEIARFLLERGADPNPSQSGLISPLILTTWRDQVECARILLENGAHVDHAAHRNNTPLIYAAENSSADMVRLLVEHGASVNRLNEGGETALVKAACDGHADRVEALLAAKADPNLGTDEGGRTALQLASIGGHLEAARLLLAGGADINAKTAAGDTPLQLARYYGHKNVAALLSGKGGKSSGQKKVDRSLETMGKVGKEEAVIWFLGHSGWAVKTRNHLMIFDYFTQGGAPAEPTLCNGWVNPDEIDGCKVSVFASHFHGDHFDTVIFDWQGQVDDITYYLGLEPENAPPYVYMPERLEKSFDDLKLTTIHSTDAGVGMVIEVDGLTIFHAGDHANGRVGLMDEFTDEIDFLADRKIRPDICFMGILGCSLGRPDEVKEGVHYTLKTLKPKVFIPMHAGARCHQYREFVDECRPLFDSIQMVYAENRGDHFVYKKGKIIDPKNAETRQVMVE